MTIIAEKGQTSSRQPVVGEPHMVHWNFEYTLQSDFTNTNKYQRHIAFHKLHILRALKHLSLFSHSRTVHLDIIKVFTPTDAQLF
jgi:hypothetical protein